MKHIRDIALTELVVSARSRRARLFALCHQQHRAATSAAASAMQADRRLSDEDMEEIRERAARSFARPA